MPTLLQHPALPVFCLQRQFIMILSDLPQEILDEVAGQLVPELRVALGSHKDVFRGHPFQDGRLALLSLVKTNRRLNAIATRHLYHTICICDLRTLFELLGTFIWAPHLAAHVRIFAVVACLEDFLDPATASKTELMFASITVGSTIYSHLERCFGEFEQTSELTWRNHYDCGQSTCALVLFLTTNLHTLHMHCPIWNAEQYDVLMSVFRSCHHQEGVVDFLPRLSRLCLTADPEASNPFLPDETTQAYMGLGRIKRLELFGAYMLIEHTDFSADVWRNVEAIHIAHACTNGAWWYRLCNEARPKLKVIEIFMSPYSPEPADKGAFGFNEALQLCTDTLKHLHLGMPNHLSHLGPDKRLSCLPSMKLLTYLKVPAMILFKSATTMRKGDICDTLPLSLERLHLSEDKVCEPWLNDDDEDSIREEEYAELLRRALLQLAFNSSGRLPRLETVRVTNYNQYWNGGGQELDGICTVEKHGPTTTVSFAPKQSGS